MTPQRKLKFLSTERIPDGYWFFGFGVGKWCLIINFFNRLIFVGPHT